MLVRFGRDWMAPCEHGSYLKNVIWAVCASLWWLGNIRLVITTMSHGAHTRDSSLVHCFPFVKLSVLIILKMMIMRRVKFPCQAHIDSKSIQFIIWNVNLEKCFSFLAVWYSQRWRYNARWVWKARRNTLGCGVRSRRGSVLKHTSRGMPLQLTQWRCITSRMPGGSLNVSQFN